MPADSAANHNPESLALHLPRTMKPWAIRRGPHGPASTIEDSRRSEEDASAKGGFVSVEALEHAAGVWLSRARVALILSAMVTIGMATNPTAPVRQEG